MHGIACSVGEGLLDGCHLQKTSGCFKWNNSSAKRSCLFIHCSIADIGSKSANEAMFRFHCRARRQFLKSLQFWLQMQWPVFFWSNILFKFGFHPSCQTLFCCFLQGYGAANNPCKKGFANLGAYHDSFGIRKVFTRWTSTGSNPKASLAWHWNVLFCWHSLHACYWRAYEGVLANDWAIATVASSHISQLVTVVKKEKMW